MSDFDSLLDELRAVRADGQRIPSYSVADTAVLVDGIEQLRARVAELEADHGEPIGVEWGVRWPDGSYRVRDDRMEAESLALYRRAAGAHVVQRDVYAPGPWRVSS